MFYALLKTKAKMRSLNVHNKDMDVQAGELVPEPWVAWYEQKGPRP
jgi:hypothetical protein